MGRTFRPAAMVLAGVLVLGAVLKASAEDAGRGEALYPVLVDEKWGFISESGEVVADPVYDSLKGLRSPFPGCTELKFAPNVLGDDGPVPVARQSASGALAWGFVGHEGEVVPPVYSEVYGFNAGVAAVSLGGKWGFIDASGAEVIPFKYDYASGFREGASAVMVDGWWGLIDLDGQYVAPLKYDMIRPLSHGPYFMFETQAKQGVMDATGEVLAEARFDQVHVLSEGLVNVDVGGKGGYYNVETKAFQIEPKFDMAAPFNDGVALVRIGDATGFIDRDGNFTVEPVTPNWRLWSNFDQFHFDWPRLSPIRKFIDVKRGQQIVGLIDARTGEMLVEPSFASIGMVYDNRAVFEDGGKFGYLDPAGNIAIPAQFDMASDFSGGLAFVRLGSRAAYIDTEGEIAISFDDRRVGGSPFRPNLAFVFGDGRERYIDRDGTTIYSFKSGCT